MESSDVAFEVAGKWVNGEKPIIPARKERRKTDRRNGTGDRWVSGDRRQK